MAKTDYKTVDEYHSTFPESVRERMERIRGVINRIAPEAEEVISYQIPAFKIGKKFLIYYAAFRMHLSISSPWSEAFLKHFESELKGRKVSKSVIQFPLNKPLPLDLITKMISFRKEEVG
jgi:uncharacterized protein YdhG (YjbR/CyaY superfamily)